MKNSTQLNIIIGIIVLIVASFVYSNYYSIPSKSVYDAALGLITFNFNSNKVEQAFFSPNTQFITLGKSATIYTSNPFPCSDYSVNSWQVKVTWPNSVKTINAPVQCNNQQISITFTPNQVGNYYVSDIYSIKKLSDGSSFSGSTLPGSTPLVVTAPSTPTCSKTNYFGDWTTKNSISNGVIQERNFNSIQADCTYKITSTEDRIVCNSGNVVGRSADEVTASNIGVYTGIQSCYAVSLASNAQIDTNVYADSSANNTDSNDKTNDTSSPQTPKSNFFSDYMFEIIVVSIFVIIIIVTYFVTRRQR